MAEHLVVSGYVEESKEKWKTVKVGSIGKIITGKTPKTTVTENYGGIVPFLTPSDDMDAKYVSKTSRTLSAIGVQTVKHFLLPANSVCVSCIGSDLGKAVITTEPTVTNQQINSIIVDTECFDVSFVYYAMVILGKYLNVISKASTTVPIVNKSRFSDYEIVCPPLQIQKKVASILSVLDEKIALNNQVNDNLHEQALTLFAKYYAQATHIVPFTSVIQILSGGTPKTGNAAFWNGTIPFFTPKDVEGAYTLFTEKTITEEGLTHCNSRLYPINTVFVTARGTVGKVSLAGVPMAMNQSCYALVGKGIDQIMVYFYTLQSVQALKSKASGVVFDAIITRDFETETVKLIATDDEGELLKVVKPMFEQMLINRIANQRLAALRDSLLPKLITGEIDVSDIDI